MDDLIQRFQREVSIVVAHVHEQADSDHFRRGLRQYTSILEPSIKRYRHHSGNGISRDELQKRYEYETAFLHLLTNVFSNSLKLSHKAEISNWPVCEQESPYRWYKLDPDFTESSRQLASEFLATGRSGTTVSVISDSILSGSTSRYLGEFYTPLTIAEHLVDLSGFQPRDLLDGKRVVDPACGGGVILTTIAERVIEEGERRGWNPRHVFRALSRNLHGFDIQPSAIVVTKSLLIYTCIPVLPRSGSEFSETFFSNIQLQDTLLAREHWSEGKGFHYIIGNPPFMSTKKGFIDCTKDYQKVLYGHPNLYQLFLWWAVQSATPRGIVSFLLPQTMLTGSYSRRLRDGLGRRTKLLGVTRITDHKGVVGDTDQQIMAVCLEAGEYGKDESDVVKVRVTRNGADVSNSQPYQVKLSRLTQRIGESPVIWVVSDNVLDYTILERLEAKCVPLADLSDVFRFGTGEYVWNQHKELLHQEEADRTVPLLSAASIEPYRFVFPYVGPHLSHRRQYSRIDNYVKSMVHTRPALLIQRTTPRKVGRRLVTSIPSGSFFSQYSEFFVENHVNYVEMPSEGSTALLYGLMGWLNSDLINFVFQLRSGTAQVSLFELGMLPANLALVEQLCPMTTYVVDAKPISRDLGIRALNDAVFKWLGLDRSHRDRIGRVLSYGTKDS